jgi:hypothetical protein
MQHQKDPDKEPTIGEDTTDLAPDPTESGFDDGSGGGTSGMLEEMNGQDGDEGGREDSDVEGSKLRAESSGGE